MSRAETNIYTCLKSSQPATWQRRIPGPIGQEPEGNSACYRTPGKPGLHILCQGSPGGLEALDGEEAVTNGLDRLLSYFRPEVAACRPVFYGLPPKKSFSIFKGLLKKKKKKGGERKTCNRIYVSWKA